MHRESIEEGVINSKGFRKMEEGQVDGSPHLFPLPHPKDGQRVKQRVCESICTTSTTGELNTYTAWTYFVYYFSNICGYYSEKKT